MNINECLKILKEHHIKYDVLEKKDSIILYINRDVINFYSYEHCCLQDMDFRLRKDIRINKGYFYKIFDKGGLNCQLMAKNR